jgi:hypothetical protein
LPPALFGQYAAQHQLQVAFDIDVDVHCPGEVPRLQRPGVVERVCCDAVQTFGGAGDIVEFGGERLYRAAGLTRIYEGTNDTQRLVISRATAG